jgi:hypothetical protein
VNLKFEMSAREQISAASMGQNRATESSKITGEEKAWRQLDTAARDHLRSMRVKARLHAPAARCARVMPEVSAP